ncbi:DUF2092 domain-containing protein [Sinorhizobium meliloti]|uniref:DUF2092 domain-containing protein n=1 Tax=Rhizobium meliloti TaxID=382 RepID=UPI000FDC908F|nr:DUF2092 domain-containing protein [Sinorhizobium meliloti]RVI52907.1 DUF2092 domain-containing protein [Sinorhizobium meliloti]
MKQQNVGANLVSGTRRRAGGLAVAAMAVALSNAPSRAQSVINPDADSVLRAMTDQLQALQEFSVEYDTDHEVVQLDGEKIQYSASGRIAMSRSAGFRMTRQGPYTDTEISFDGKVVSLYGKRLNVYARIDSPGPSIDEAVAEIQAATGFDAAGAYFLSADPYAALAEGVLSGSLVGTAFVGGMLCDHLAFRNDDVDWQLWISKGEQNLPLKYVITTKWVTGSPQYTLRFRNWATGGVSSKSFEFKPPTDARKVDVVHTDVVGDLLLEAQQ